MEKFKFYCPTEIIFGKDSELSTASLNKKYKLASERDAVM